MITNQKYIVKLCLFYRLDSLKYEGIVPNKLVEDLYRGQKIQGHQRIVQDAFARVSTDLKLTEEEYETFKKEIFFSWYNWITRTLETP